MSLTKTSVNLPSVFAIRPEVRVKFFDRKYELAQRYGEDNVVEISDTPRTSSQQSVVYNNKMFIFGGRSDSDDVFMYDMNENVMERLYVKGTPPKIRLYHSMNLDISRDCFYLFGGVSTKNSSLYFADLFKFDLLKLSWEEIRQDCTSFKKDSLALTQPNLYTPVTVLDSRSGHVGAYRECSDTLIVFGGLKNGNKTNDLHVFAFSEKKWYKYTPINNDVVTPRSYCNGQYCKGSDELIVFGGDTPSSLTGDTFILNLTTHFWTKLIINNPSDTMHTFPPVFGHTSIMVDFKGPPFFLIAYGGTSKSSLNICYLLDITNRKWTCLNRDDINFPKLNCCCLGFHGNSMFLYGGRDESGQKTNTLHSVGLHVPSVILRIFPRMDIIIENQFKLLSDITIKYESLY